MHNTIIRIAGALEAGPRGPVLHATDGSVWKLVLDDDVEPIFDRPITVEGFRDGTTIAAYYCAPLSD